MSKVTLPKYSLHKPTGQARVRISGKDHWLGPHGSAKSCEKYAKVIYDWQQSFSTLPPVDLAIGEMSLIYLERSKRHYMKAG